MAEGKRGAHAEDDGAHRKDGYPGRARFDQPAPQLRGGDQAVGNALREAGLQGGLDGQVARLQHHQPSALPRRRRRPPAGGGGAVDQALRRGGSQLHRSEDTRIPRAGDDPRDGPLHESRAGLAPRRGVCRAREGAGDHGGQLRSRRVQGRRILAAVRQQPTRRVQLPLGSRGRKDDAPCRLEKDNGHSDRRHGRHEVHVRDRESGDGRIRVARVKVCRGVRPARLPHVGRGGRGRAPRSLDRAPDRQARDGHRHRPRRELRRDAELARGWRPRPR